MKQFLIKFLRWALYKLTGKSPVLFDDFYKLIEDQAKKEGNQHFAIRIHKSPFDNGLQFDAYIAKRRWIRDQPTPEACLNELLKCGVEPKELPIDEVLI